MTILTGNMLVNITLSTLNDRLLGENLFLSIFLTTFVLLLFGEVTPKTVAVKKRESFAYVFAPFVQVVSYIVMPIARILGFVSSLVLPEDRGRIVGEAEMKSAIEEGRAQGHITERISALAENALELDEKDIDLLAIPTNGFKIFTMSEQPDLACHFRMDKDLSAVVIIGNDETDIRAVILRWEYLSGRDNASFVIVPETTSVLSAYTQLVEKGAGLLVLVDEHGRITGIVPGQNILSAVFTPPGKKENTFRSIGGFTIYPGKILLGELPLSLPVKRARTLSGAIVEILGRIPVKGEVFQLENMEIRIIDANQRLIRKVAIKQEEIE